MSWDAVDWRDFSRDGRTAVVVDRSLSEWRLDCARFSASIDAEIVGVNPQPVHCVLSAANKHTQRIVGRKTSHRIRE
jgi:hypothetical protein